MNVEVLKKANINYDGAVKRFMGNSRLYENLLVEFLADQTFENAIKAHQNGDKEALFTHLHTLKGVTGNLNFTELYEELCKVVNSLREHNFTTINKDFESIETEYNNVVDAIKKAAE